MSGAVISPIRIIPASSGQLAADRDAPAIVIFGIDLEIVALATARRGLGWRLVAGPPRTARVVASPIELAGLAEELARLGSGLAALINRYLQPEPAWRLRTRTLALDVPQIMGIVNLTEDSFSGDGVGRGVFEAVRRAEELRSAGATIIDIGAETARADRPSLDAAEEAKLVAPVVAAFVHEGHCVSIDSYKAEVAQTALDAGAEIVNDISGLTAGPGAAAAAAAARSGYVLNYSFSVPKRRPDEPPVYQDVVEQTVAWMFERTDQLRRLGMHDAQIAIDPGIAFGKSHDEDLQILRRLGELTTLGLPLLIAHSRKNFIGSVSMRPPQERDLETHIVSALAYAQGARIFRVHDAEGTRRAAEMARAIASAAAGAFAPGDGSWPWREGASAEHMTTGAADKAAPPGQRW